MSLVRCLAVALLLLWPGAAIAGTDGDTIAAVEAIYGDGQPLVDAFQAIQTAADDGDSAALAKWVAYPITVDVDGEPMEITDADAFADNYGLIVTDAIAETISKQRFGDLFVNADGVMFGDGEVWLSAVCNDDACSSSDWKIITIQSAE